MRDYPEAVTIDTFIRLKRAEKAHLKHVASLATKLFEGVYVPFKLKKSDIRLLKAAALLHDIGFAEKPSKHVEKSVKCVLETNLKGYSREEHQYIAAIVYLHRRNYKPVLRRNEIRTLPIPEKAIQLAAILRIADGLDHSHIQDCSIQSIRVTKTNVFLRVLSPFYKNNASWALGKANLWNEYLPLPIDIRTNKSSSKNRFCGVVEPSDSTLEAFRSLLYSQYRLYVDNIPGTCEGTDSSYLHDLRVALRRARMLFTFFKPAISDLQTQPHLDYIKGLTKKLGPYRDSQVWIDFLDDVSQKPALKNNPKWQQFVQREKRKDKRHIPAISRLVKNESNARKSRNLSLFLRSELPSAIQESRRIPYRTFASGRMKKYILKLFAQRELSERDDPETAHEVRKVIRKIRYYAEYTDAALPPPALQLTKKLKAVADALGTMHDLDVHLARIKTYKGISPPPALEKMIHTQHRKAWQDYQSSWRQLTDQRFQQRIHKMLSNV